MRVVYTGDLAEGQKWLHFALHRMEWLRVNMKAQGLQYGSFRRYASPTVYCYGYILPTGLEAVYIVTSPTPMTTCVDKVPENPPWEGSPTYWAMADGLTSNYDIDQTDLRLLCPDFQILTTIDPVGTGVLGEPSGQMVTIENAPTADISVEFRVKWDGDTPPSPVGSGSGSAVVGIRIGEVDVPIANNPHYPMEEQAPIGYYIKVYTTNAFDTGGTPGETLSYWVGRFTGDWPTPEETIMPMGFTRYYTTGLDHVFIFRATGDLIEVLVDDVVTFSVTDTGPSAGVPQGSAPHLNAGRLWVGMQNSDGPGMLQLTSTQWNAPFSE